MKYFSIILTVMVTALIGRATEPQTGWFFDQSTLQSFYLFDAITIDGLVVEGDGSGDSGECSTSDNCDVVGAFRRGVCDDPGYQNSQQLCEIFSVWNTDEEICIGWRYADSNGATTVPLMGKEGAEGDNTFTYANGGESAYLKVYDSSNGSTLDLSPSSELPGWDLNAIFTIEGTSTANNTFGCTNDTACNYDAGATADDGSCWSENAFCECADGEGAVAGCDDVCNSGLTLDDCGDCDGGNAAMDCANVCYGQSYLDDCGVCDADSGNDEVTCTGCTNSDADCFADSSCGCTDINGYLADCTIDNDSCEFTVSAVDDLAADPLVNKVYLNWSQPVDTFVNDDGNYSYDVYMDGSLHLNSSTEGTNIYGLTAGQEYSFYVIAVHEYGSSEASNTVTAIPLEPTGIPTWRLQLVAEIDSYDQFENSGNPDWLLSDDQNFLGAATNGDWGYDEDHDIPEPPVGPSSYISLFFDHPEWDTDAWGAHFTEDIVSDNEDFFDANLTQWNGTVISNVPGSTSITFSVDTVGAVSVPKAHYEMYVELDGVITSISHDVTASTTIEFYMDGSGQKDFSVTIGNRVPTVDSDALSADGGDRSIQLDWAASGGLYPATSYTLYREEAADINQSGTSYNDNEDRQGHTYQGLLYESTWGYTVTASNDAGESTDGYSIKTSGGAQTDIAGTQSDASATTDDNIDPVAVLGQFHCWDYNTETYCGGSEGVYNPVHDGSSAENINVINVVGDASYDVDTLDVISRYSWSLDGDSYSESGHSNSMFNWYTGNVHEAETKYYIATLLVESDYPIKGGIATRSNLNSIGVSLSEEPNADPVSSTALGLIVVGDGLSVTTSDDFDGTDGNDYDGDGQVWYEPHDNNGDQNNADLYFTASGSSDDDGDELFYSWSLTTGALAGFSYDDLNGNGEYDFGEPFTLQGGDEIYVDIDLGDYGYADGPAAVNVDDGASGTNNVDLHQSLADDIYILSMTVTDVYGDSDVASLIVGVKDERNEGPTADEHREQPNWYIAYGDDDRVVTVDAACDNLGAGDSDNDDLTYDWSYSGDGDADLDQFDSSYDHDGGGDILAATADLGLGTHKFTFTVTDSYGASDMASTTFTILNEPGAPAGNISINHTDLKYTIIDVSENSLADYPEDCHGYVYDGADYNTARLDLLRDGELIASWDDSDGGDSGTLTHFDESLDAETTYEYTIRTFNSDGDAQEDEIAEADVSTTTHDRPQVTVTTPNGLEIRSIGDMFNVDFSTTQQQYISKIEVFYLADGETEVADADASSDSSVNSGGSADGNYTVSFSISDDTGLEVNYNAKVRVRVHDVGDYNGDSSQSLEDDSDDPFTMAAHTLHHDYDAGWHLFGTALEIDINDPYMVEHLEGPNNMGNWGQDWVAYDVGGTYDGLTLNLGEGYYLAVANGATMEVRGNPVIGDPVSTEGNLSLDKGWNLIANPLVNKIAKGTLTINDGSGDLLFEDAVDAGWIAPTIYGWFENSYVSIDRLMPFGGYWVNTSRNLTIKVRPHLFEDGELTRKVENMAGKLEIKARDISGDGSSDFVTIGIDENATNEFSYGEDEYDLPRQAYASMGGEYIDLKIGTDLMKDIRSAEYEEFQAWNLTLEHEKVDNDIELSWGDLSAFEDDIHLVINGEAINMHQESAIEISSNINEFAVVVGNLDSYLNPIPDAFGLGAAYPNPFNPVTKLDLALNVEGHVNMSVFNIRGQVVEVLVDRNMKAGYHNITWNADGISSGMYFVKVETGTNAAMQKLMLLK